MVPSPLRSALRHFVSLLLAALPVAAQGADQDGSSWSLTEERLARLAPRALELVERRFEVELVDTVTVRISNLEEVRGILREELAGQFLRQFGDEEVAEQSLRQFVDAYSMSLIAKFSWKENAILALPDNLERLAGEFERPELLSDELVGALLVHEAVHARDHARYDLAAFTGGGDTADALQARNAVLEGHAQHAARPLCEATGWGAGFVLFDGLIGSLNPAQEALDPISRMMLRMAGAQAAFAYREGEEFVAALVAELGLEGVDRAFRAPPASTEEILHPDWYLDPAARPASTLDFERVLARVEARFDPERWRATRVPISPQQLQIGLSLLPEEEVSRMVAGVASCQAVVHADRENPGAKQVTAALYECTNATEAAYFVAGSERLVRAKDDLLPPGIELEGASYRPVDRDGLRGVWGEKLLRYAGEDLPVAVLVVARGAVVFEITYSNEPVELDEVVALTLDVLQPAADAESPQAPAGAEDG